MQMYNIELLFSCEFAGCRKCKETSFDKCLLHRNEVHLPRLRSRRRKKRLKPKRKRVLPISLAFQPTCVGYIATNDDGSRYKVDFDLTMKGFFKSMPLLSVYLRPFEVSKLAAVCRSFNILVECIENGSQFGAHFCVTCAECRLWRLHEVYQQFVAPHVTAVHRSEGVVDSLLSKTGAAAADDSGAITKVRSTEATFFSSAVASPSPFAEEGTDDALALAPAIMHVLHFEDSAFDRMSIVNKLHLTYFLTRLKRLRVAFDEMVTFAANARRVAATLDGCSDDELLDALGHVYAFADVSHLLEECGSSKKHSEALAALCNGHSRDPLTCSEAYNILESPVVKRRLLWRQTPFVSDLEAIESLVLSDNSISFAVTHESDLFVPFVVNAHLTRAMKNAISAVDLSNCQLLPSNVLNVCSGLLWSRHSLRCARPFEEVRLNCGALRVLNLGHNAYVDDECVDPLLATIAQTCVGSLRQLWLNHTSVSDVACGLLSIFFRTVKLTEDFKSQNMTLAVLLMDNSLITHTGVNTVDRLFKDEVLHTDAVLFMVAGCKYQYKDRPEAQGFDEWDNRICEKVILPQDSFY